MGWRDLNRAPFQGFLGKWNYMGRVNSIYVLVCFHIAITGPSHILHTLDLRSLCHSLLCCQMMEYTHYFEYPDKCIKWLQIWNSRNLLGTVWVRRNWRVCTAGSWQGCKANREMTNPKESLWKYLKRWRICPGVSRGLAECVSHVGYGKPWIQLTSLQIIGWASNELPFFNSLPP